MNDAKFQELCLGWNTILIQSTLWICLRIYWHSPIQDRKLSWPFLLFVFKSLSWFWPCIQIQKGNTKEAIAFGKKILGPLAETDALRESLQVLTIIDFLSNKWYLLCVILIFYTQARYPALLFWVRYWTFLSSDLFQLCHWHFENIFYPRFIPYTACLHDSNPPETSPYWKNPKNLFLDNQNVPRWIIVID